MTTMEMRPYRADTLGQPEAAPIERGVFSKFREWVTQVANREPVPNYGFGGPVETPFADSIPTPENEARRLPLVD